MPELPEVETLLQGIKPYVENQIVRKVVIRDDRLRWPIPAAIKQEFINQKIYKLERRGKYLLFFTSKGTAILHLGMSGSVKLKTEKLDPSKHDHYDLIFDDFYLRYTDPRRFGSLLWTRSNPYEHPLLAKLGLEPLEDNFDGDYLFAKAANRTVGVKQFIMNASIVVGVGNIYATESLFLAKINPLTPSKKLSLKQWRLLAVAIKKILLGAIKQGGTTLKDYYNSAGEPGYFKQKLNVYGREGLPCVRCKTLLKNIRIQNRATVFCPRCQPKMAVRPEEAR